MLLCKTQHPEQVIELRRLRKSGTELKTLAAMFNIADSTVSRIAREVSYKNN